MRVVLAPMFRSARWYTEDGKSVQYEWFEDGGKSAAKEALATIDGAMNNRSGRLSGMVVPSQADVRGRLEVVTNEKMVKHREAVLVGSDVVRLLATDFKASLPLLTQLPDGVCPIRLIARPLIHP